jgi:hypothetical protein
VILANYCVVGVVPNYDTAMKVLLIVENVANVMLQVVLSDDGSGILLRCFIYIGILIVCTRVFLGTLLYVISFAIMKAKIAPWITISADLYPYLRIVLLGCGLTAESLTYGTNVIKPYFPMSLVQLSADSIVLEWESFTVSKLKIHVMFDFFDFLQKYNIFPKIIVDNAVLSINVTSQSDWGNSYGRYLAAWKKHGLANYMTSIVENTRYLGPTSWVSSIIDSVMANLNLEISQCHIRSVFKCSRSSLFILIL